MAERPGRNLAMELVRVTEAAAMAAGRWVGRGDKIQADQAAVDAMRLLLQTVAMKGVVVIGEGEKDQAPMLFNGEEVGSGEGPEVDVAVDPLEGTELAATGQPNAIAVMAVSEKGTMLFPPTFYMEKLAVGREAANAVDIAAAPAENVGRIAEARKKAVSDVVVAVLNRDRNQDLIEAVRDSGARVQLLPHGDTAPAVAAARAGTGVDAVMGIGGSTEGVLAAAALKALGGAMQARLWPLDDSERAALKTAGHDERRVLATNDLVGGEEVFVAATGVTGGSFLRGVLYADGGCVTESMVVRSRSGTARWIVGEHSLEKLESFTGLSYH